MLFRPCRTLVTIAQLLYQEFQRAQDFSQNLLTCQLCLPFFFSLPPLFSLSYDVTKSKKDCLLLQSYQRRKISRNTLSQILYPETLVLKHLFLVQDSSLLPQVQDIYTKGYKLKTAQSTEGILKVPNLLVK